MRAATVYLLVQILAYGLDMGTFVLLHEVWGMAPVPANVGGKIVAGGFAFFSHRHLTFAVARDGAILDQALRYVLLLIANSVASSAMLALFLTFAPYPVAAKFVADTILIAVSFTLSKSVVFRGAKAGDGR